MDAKYNRWIVQDMYLILTVCIVLAGVSGEDAPKIQPFYFPKNLTSGKNVKIICSSTEGTHPLTFEWYKDGIPVSHSSHITIKSDEDYTLLNIDSATWEDAGNYTCVLSNSQGSDSHTAILSVFASPVWTKEPQDTSVANGGLAVIDCEAAGYPQPAVTWRRFQGKTWITVKTEDRYTVASNGSLIIRPTNLDDTGSYECKASNGMANDLVRTISLTVHVAARFEEKSSVHTVRLGETAKLSCEAVGDHPTTITWTYNQQSITQQEGSRYEIFERIADKETVSTLNIHEVDRGDNGIYTCVVKNSYGKDEKKLKLTVYEVPGAPSDVRVEQTWSQSASVRWTAPYDGNSAITQYIVQYWKDSGTSHRLEEATISPTQNTVTLQDLHPGTTYIVRVVAMNDVGRGNPSENHQFQTKESAPSSPPMDVTVDAKGAGALKIKWKAPPRDQWNGQLKGYYVGYKIHEQSDPYTYKTVDFSKSLEEEYRLSGLKKSTEYAIVVQVFNIAGTGPPSHEIVVKTSEKDPPPAPYIWVESQSRSTISLKWDHKASKEQAIHYVLYFKEDMGTWTELAIPSSSQNQYTLNNLREGTRYQVYLRASSEVGQSDPSEILTIKTEGGALSDSSSHPIHERENHTPVYLRETVVAPVGISLAVVVLVIIGAFVYVRREERKYRAALASVTDKRYPYGGNHTLPHMTSQRYVDVDKSRPLIRSPLPPPPSASDPYPTYPAPYATLPLRGGTLDRRRFSEDQQRAAFIAQHTLDRKKSIGHVIQETAEVHHYDVAA